MARPIDPEGDLLLLCCRPEADAEVRAELLRACGNPNLQWPRFAALAGRHRVRPQAFTGLQRIGSAAVPSRITDAFTRFARYNAQRNLFLLGELFGTLDLLMSRGITAAPFKGPMLAQRVYGSLSLREAGDLDLLVRREDILRAKRLLIDSGYCPIFPTSTPAEVTLLQSLQGQQEEAYVLSHCEHHVVREQGLVNLDLHWNLALREFSVDVDPQELWSWLGKQTLAGRSVLSFAPEELLLVLCINGAKDGWARLDRVCDIAWLMRAHPDLDWNRVFGRAGRLGILRMVRLGVYLAVSLLNAPALPDAIRMARCDSMVSVLARQIRRQFFMDAEPSAEDSSPGQSLFHLRLRERLRDRFRYCLRHLTPTVGDWTALALPGQLSFLHYLLRPLRLLARLGWDGAQNFIGQPAQRRTASSPLSAAR